MIKTLFSSILDSLHSSNIRIGSDGLSLVCGDDLDKTQTENSVTEEPTEEGNVEEKPSTAESEAEKEAEHIGRGKCCMLALFIFNFPLFPYNINKVFRIKLYTEVKLRLCLKIVEFDC